MSVSPITTHVLDTATGKPAQGVSLYLYQLRGDDFIELASGTTNSDGRVTDLLEADHTLDVGTYKMKFILNEYFDKGSISYFYPYAEIVFKVTDNSHYHIPLLLSPYGYSTYRGS